MHLINMVIDANIVTSNIVHEFINREAIDIGESREELISQVTRSTSSRRMTYKIINPSL